jgi:putative ABC transport system permease protein
MLNDLRFAFRLLLKNPAFTAVAIVAIALGIGANTAVLSLVNALLIRPLPYRDPARIVLMLEHFRAQHLDAIPVSAPEFVDYQTNCRSFDKMAVFQPGTFNFAGGDRPERIFGAVGSADLFNVLGVVPIRGRVFEAADCTAGHDDVLIISERLWKNRFNSDPQTIGSKIIANGRSFTIVGVMPASFEFPIPLFGIQGAQFGERADVWQPLAFTAQELKIRYSRGYAIVARLAHRVSAKQAQAELDTVTATMRKNYPDNYPKDDSFGITAFPLNEVVLGPMKPLLLILLAAVFLVLLIACANLTTMMLARAASREREMGIRVALGASRWRLLRQVLVESVFLSLCGGIAGVLLGIWGLDLLKRIGTQTVPRLGEVNLDWHVLIATFAIAVGTGIIFGLVPGLVSGDPNLTETLKEGGRGLSSGARRNRLRQALVIAEVALALVLLTSAGLLIKSFVQLQNVDAGFNPRHVLTMEISLPALTYTDNASKARFYNEAQKRIASIPGIKNAGFTNILPMSGTNSDSSFSIEGRTSDDKNPSPDEEFRQVSPGYFEAMEISLLRGRQFRESDNADAPPVTIIDVALAKRYWPNEDAIGKRINIGASVMKEKWATIIGIVGNVRHRGLDYDALPEYYMPITQTPNSQAVLVVRSAQDAGSLSSAVRSALREVDPAQPIAHVRTLEQVVADSVAPRRLSIWLLGLFAAIALALASIGIYGVMSFLVVQRTHELGVRMALGAQRHDILRLVVGHAAKLVLTGTAIGLVFAFAFTHLLAAMLYHVSPHDLTTFGLVTVVLGAIGLVASYIPTSRLIRTDPMLALTHTA